MKSSNSWNHSMCYDCWRRERGLDIPVRVKEHDPEICCFCGRWTIEGIFVRKDPAKMTCGCQKEP